MLRKMLKKLRAILLSYLPIPGVADPLILCFHTVRDSSARRGYVSGYRAQSMEAFAAQVEWLSNFCDFVSLDDIALGERKSLSGRQKVAITFDDGYRDNVLIALPLLEKYGAPVTLFVATKYLTNSMLPWWDFMDWTIENGFLCDLEAGTASKAKLNAKQAASQRQHFRARFRDGDQATRDDLVLTLSKLCECTEMNDFMSSEELAEFIKNPLTTIGAHTHSHINSALLTKDEFAIELESNIEKLSEFDDSRIKYFAFPYGDDAQIMSDCQSILEVAGLSAAFTTTPMCVEQRHGRFSLPRMIVSPRGDLYEFKAQIKQRLLKNKYPLIKVLMPS